MSLLRNRSLITVSLGHFTIDVFTSMSAVLLTFFSLPMNLSNAQIGFAAGLFAMIGALFQPLFGWFTDRRGSRWLGAASIFWTLSWLSLAVFLGQRGSFILLLIPFVLAALGSAAFHPQGAMQATQVDAGRQASGAAIFFFFGQAGLGLGPAIAGLILGGIGPNGIPILALLGLPVVWLLARMPGGLAVHTEATKTHPAPMPRPQQLALGVLLALVLLVALRSWANFGITTFLPKFYQAEGWSPQSYGLVSTLFMIGSATGGIFGGPAADRWGRRLIVAATLGAAALPLVLLPLAQGATTFILAATAGALAGRLAEHPGGTGPDAAARAQGHRLRPDPGLYVRQRRHRRRDQWLDGRSHRAAPDPAVGRPGSPGCGAVRPGAARHPRPRDQSGNRSHPGLRPPGWLEVESSKLKVVSASLATSPPAGDGLIRVDPIDPCTIFFKFYQIITIPDQIYRIISIGSPHSRITRSGRAADRAPPPKTTPREVCMEELFRMLLVRNAEQAAAEEAVALAETPLQEELAAITGEDSRERILASVDGYRRSPDFIDVVDDLPRARRLLELHRALAGLSEPTPQTIENTIEAYLGDGYRDRVGGPAWEADQTRLVDSLLATKLLPDLHTGLIHEFTAILQAADFVERWVVGDFGEITADGLRRALGKPLLLEVLPRLHLRPEPPQIDAPPPIPKPGREQFEALGERVGRIDRAVDELSRVAPRLFEVRPLGVESPAPRPPGGGIFSRLFGGARNPAHRSQPRQPAAPGSLGGRHANHQRRRPRAAPGAGLRPEA